LKNKRIAAAVFTIALVAIVVGAFSAQLHSQLNFKYNYSENNESPISSFASLNAVTINRYTILAFTPTFSVSTSPPIQTYLNNTTRNEVFTYIGQNPGMQFRAIAAALCLPLGLAEYHLGVLVKSGLVSFVRDGRYKRFFVSKQYSKKEMQTISLLRHKTTKRIIEVLLHKKELSHSRLADEVEITSQALTWQMKTLRNTRFVLQVNEGLKTIYSLDQATMPGLIEYFAIVE
jgi:hypothetical protein